jgi:2-oxoglutarate dehydrogenase N-terminus
MFGRLLVRSAAPIKDMMPRLVPNSLRLITFKNNSGPMGLMKASYVTLPTTKDVNPIKTGTPEPEGNLYGEASFDINALSNSNMDTTYLETMWRSWQEDTSSVEPSVATYFSSLLSEKKLEGSNFQASAEVGAQGSAQEDEIFSGIPLQAILDHLKVQRLVIIPIF